MGKHADAVTGTLCLILNCIFYGVLMLFIFCFWDIAFYTDISVEGDLAVIGDKIISRNAVRRKGRLCAPLSGCMGKKVSTGAVGEEWRYLELISACRSGLARCTGDLRCCSDCSVLNLTANVNDPLEMWRSRNLPPIFALHLEDEHRLKLRHSLIILLTVVGVYLLSIIAALIEYKLRLKKRVLSQTNRKARLTWSKEPFHRPNVPSNPPPDLVNSVVSSYRMKDALTAATHGLSTGDVLIHKRADRLNYAGYGDGYSGGCAGYDEYVDETEAYRKEAHECMWKIKRTHGLAYFVTLLCILYINVACLGGIIYNTICLVSMALYGEVTPLTSLVTNVWSSENVILKCRVVFIGVAASLFITFLLYVHFMRSINFNYKSPRTRHKRTMKKVLKNPGVDAHTALKIMDTVVMMDRKNNVGPDERMVNPWSTGLSDSHNCSYCIGKMFYKLYIALMVLGIVAWVMCTIDLVLVYNAKCLIPTDC